MEKQKRLSLNGATILDDNIIYFAINNGNGLFSYNLSGKILTFLGIFPGEDQEESNLYCTAIKYDHYLLFPPHNAKKFAVYDIEKHDFTVWDYLPQMESKEVGRSILYKDKLYLFGTWMNPYLLKIDLLKRQAVFNEIWMKKIHPAGRKEKYCHISTTGLNRNGEKLFITVTTDEGAEVVCFDMDKETVDRLELPVRPLISEWVYATAYGNEDKIWAVMDSTGQIIEMDRKVGTYKLHDAFIKKKSLLNGFLRIFQDGRCFLLIPYKANRIMKMDMDTGKADALYCEVDREIEEYGKQWEKYSWSEYKNGILYVFRKYTCSLKIVNLMENSTEEVIFPDTENISALSILDKENGFLEGLTVNNSLEVYVNEIMKHDSGQRAHKENRGDIIHNYIVNKD